MIGKRLIGKRWYLIERQSRVDGTQRVQSLNKGASADVAGSHKSLYGTNPAHGGAALKLHTGSDQFVRPSMGSWVTYGLGTENQNLPAFITICPTLTHGGVNNWGAGFLPAHCQGTPIGNASQAAASVSVKHIRNSHLSTDHQRRQLNLIRAMNQDHLQTIGRHQALEGRLNSFELAFRM